MVGDGGLREAVQRYRDELRRHEAVLLTAGVGGAASVRMSDVADGLDRLLTASAPDERCSRDDPHEAHDWWWSIGDLSHWGEGKHRCPGMTAAGLAAPAAADELNLGVRVVHAWIVAEADTGDEDGEGPTAEFARGWNAAIDVALPVLRAPAAAPAAGPASGETLPDCDYCTEHGFDHDPVAGKPFAVFVAPQRDHDGQPTHLHVSYAGGHHVGEGEAEWVRRALRPARAAAGPATDGPLDDELRATVASAVSEIRGVVREARNPDVLATVNEVTDRLLAALAAGSGT